MKKLLMGLLLLIPLVIFAASISPYAKNQEKCISELEIKFENDFRKLWIDHVLWTSNYITSATTAGVEVAEKSRGY